MSILALLQTDHRGFDDPVTITFSARLTDTTFADTITINYCQLSPINRDTISPDLIERTVIINVWKSDMGDSPPTPHKADRVTIDGVNYRIASLITKDEGERYSLTLLREV